MLIIPIHCKQDGAPCAWRKLQLGMTVTGYRKPIFTDAIPSIQLCWLPRMSKCPSILPTGSRSRKYDGQAIWPHSHAIFNSTKCDLCLKAVCFPCRLSHILGSACKQMTPASGATHAHRISSSLMKQRTPKQESSSSALTVLFSSAMIVIHTFMRACTIVLAVRSLALRSGLMTLPR